MFLGGDQSSWRGSGVVRLALIWSGGTWGGACLNPSSHVCPFLPFPHWQPCPPAWLGAWPPGTGPGTAADGFLFLPGVAGAGSSFPSPQLPSRPLIHRQTHTVSLSPRS